MLRDRFLRKLFFTALIIVIFAPLLLKQMAKVNPLDPLHSAQRPLLSETRKEHILHGNETGGGHLYGTGAPCESEFPADWTADDIISSVTVAAANDNLDWRQQRNGNYVAETMDRNVKIRIVMNSARREIITAYPLNTPRNPCDRPAANDN